MLEIVEIAANPSTSKNGWSVGNFDGFDLAD